MPRASSVAFVVATAACAALALAPAPAGARVLLTVDEALKLAFPDATIERRTVYLTPAQLARAEQLGGHEPTSAIVHPYVATRDGAVVGTAYFDVHVVRTLAETVMVTVDSGGRIGRVEVLSFDEPPDYLPRAEWYRQFDGQRLDRELELRRAIRPVAGATLTARATTDAARRVLALHQAIVESTADAPSSTAAPRGAEPATQAPPSGGVRRAPVSSR